MYSRFIVFLLVIFTTILPSNSQTTKKRAREIGIQIGVLPTGPYNAITDVSGVMVGHFTKVEGDNIRTGATAILPHSDNIFQQKVPAAIYVGNGYGKLAGSTQVMELGNLETPILLTNTLAVATGVNALITHSLAQPGNERVQSVNAVVGETNDGYLNDIRGRHLTESDMLLAIADAKAGKVAEGNVGAGTGTICFGFKGGIGTSSRKLPASMGGYMLGVLVQSNFGGVMHINGVPVGQEWGKFYLKDQLQDQADGSCMIVVATDAPLDSRNLERLAARAMLGLAKTGDIASNGSGDYVIAFSTFDGNRVPHQPATRTGQMTFLHNDALSPLFLAVIEATEEAIVNSLLMAEDMTGMEGRQIKALPVDELLEVMKKYKRLTID